MRVIDGADRGRVFENLATPVTVGREEGNSIQLNDERVSRFHVKIQEDQNKIVLADLESTNGTRVNGDDVQLRILRHGDMISLGRSVLVFGSREQIAARLAAMRGGEPKESGTRPPLGSWVEGENEAEFDVNYSNDFLTALSTAQPPELPEHLSPAQAAQLAEMLDFLHTRIRELLDSVREDVEGVRVSLEAINWQELVDLQARLAEYLKQIGEP